MKRIFLVKRDPARPAGEDNWIMMNAFDFWKFIKSEEGQERKGNFGRFRAEEENDTVLFIECDEEAAREIRQENDHQDYLRQEKRNKGYILVSLEELLLEGKGPERLENIVDENMDTLEIALDHIVMEELIRALNTLSKEEKALVLGKYFKDEEITWNDYIAEMGLTKKQALIRRQKALEKIKKKLKNNIFCEPSFGNPDEMHN